MKIIDCFPFFQEHDILLMRLHELNDYVDAFVISELNVTHTGIPKKFNFNDNKTNYSKFLDKINYYRGYDKNITNEYSKLAEDHGVIPSLESDENHKEIRTTNWAREVYQRCIIEDELHQMDLSDDDVIILSDCDEIPRPELLQQIKDGTIDMTDKILCCEQDMYIFNFHYYCSKFNGTKIITWKNFKDSSLTLDHLRVKPHLFKQKKVTIKNGGWHLSYFGSYDTILKKYQSYTHNCDPLQQRLCDKTLTDEEKKENIHKFFKEMIDDKHLQFIEDPSDILPPIAVNKELYLNKYI